MPSPRKVRFIVQGVRPAKQIQVVSQFHTSNGGVLQIAPAKIGCELVPDGSVSCGDREMMASLGAVRECLGVTLGGEGTFNLENPDDREVLNALLTHLQNALTNTNVDD